MTTTSSNVPNCLLYFLWIENAVLLVADNAKLPELKLLTLQDFLFYTIYCYFKRFFFVGGYARNKKLRSRSVAMLLRNIAS